MKGILEGDGKERCESWDQNHVNTSLEIKVQVTSCGQLHRLILLAQKLKKSSIPQTDCPLRQTHYPSSHTSEKWRRLSYVMRKIPSEEENWQNIIWNQIEVGWEW